MSDYKHNWVERWINYYVGFRSYIGAGRGIVEFLIDAIKMSAYAGAMMIFMGFKIEDFPKWFFVVVGFLYLLSMALLGWGWDKVKGFEISAEWGNVRNPMMMRIEDKVKKKR